MKAQNIKNQVSVLALVPAYGNDAIQAKELTNSFELGTRKLKATITVDLGKDQNILSVADKLPVFITKEYEGGHKSETIYMSVAALLTVATNGLFELFNNCKESNFSPLTEALGEGYFYSSSFEMSKKAPPFSWAEFTVWLKEQELPADIQPKADKFLSLTTKQMASLSHEQLEQIAWLYPLIISKGYTKPTAASNSLLDDLI